MVQKIKSFLFLAVGVFYASGQMHFDVGKNNLDVKTLLSQTSPIQLKMGSNTLSIDPQGNQYKNPYNLMVKLWKANSTDPNLVNPLAAGSTLPEQKITGSDGKPLLPIYYPQFSQLLWDSAAAPNSSSFVFLKLKPDLSDFDGIKIKKTLVAGNDTFDLDPDFNSDSNTNSINYGDKVLILNMKTKLLLSAATPNANSSSNLSTGQLVNFKMDEPNLGSKKWYLCGAQIPAPGVGLSSFLGKVEGNFNLILQNTYFVIESGDNPAKTGAVLEGDKIKLNFCNTGYYIKTTSKNNKFFETETLQKGLIIANNEATEPNSSWTTTLVSKPAAVIPTSAVDVTKIPRYEIAAGDTIALRNLKTGRYLVPTNSRPIYLQPLMNGHWAAPLFFILGAVKDKSPDAKIKIPRIQSQSTSSAVLGFETVKGSCYTNYTWINSRSPRDINMWPAAAYKGRGDLALNFALAEGDDKTGYTGKINKSDDPWVLSTGDMVFIGSTFACSDLQIKEEPVDTLEVYESNIPYWTGLKDPALFKCVWIIEPYSAGSMKMQYFDNLNPDPAMDDGFLRYGDSYALKNQINGYYIGKPNSLYGGRMQSGLTTNCKFMAQPAGGIAKVNDYVKSGDYIITRQFVGGNGYHNGAFLSFGSHGAGEDYYVDNPFTGVSAFARIYKYGAQVGDKIATGDKIYFQFYPDTYIYGGGREVYWNTDGTSIGRASSASPNMPADRGTFEKNYLFTVDAITSQDYIKKKMIITDNQGVGPSTNATAKNCQW